MNFDVCIEYIHVCVCVCVVSAQFLSQSHHIFYYKCSAFYNNAKVNCCYSDTIQLYLIYVSYVS